MKFYKGLSAAAAAAVLLTGCGNDSNGYLDTATDGTTPLTVTAIDGYLKNAVVCLDVNDNQVCDDSDPQNKQGTKEGVYGLFIPSDAKVAEHKVIVNVIKGKTIDMDTPKITAQKSYSMTAPKGEAVVTPITTLVNFKMEELNLSKENAAKEVLSDLGISDQMSVDSFLGNYMTDNTVSNSNVHRIAKFIAEHSNKDISLFDFNGIISQAKGELGIKPLRAVDANEKHPAVDANEKHPAVDANEKHPAVESKKAKEAKKDKEAKKAKEARKARTEAQNKAIDAKKVKKVKTAEKARIDALNKAKAARTDAQNKAEKARIDALNKAKAAKAARTDAQNKGKDKIAK